MHRVALLLLVGAVALTVAKTPIEHCCSHGDRTSVQKQWRGLFANQDAKFRAGFSRLVLLDVIKDHPEAKDLFKNVDVEHPTAGPFTAHAMRIFNALDMAINLLDDPEALEAALDHLAYQHYERAGVKREYFTAFGQSIKSALPKVLSTYNSMAWDACFKEILNKIAGRLQA